MAEALNFNGVDLKLFFDANTAATISIFTFLVIPPFLLCLLCVLALVLAKDINAKIRLLLINIFTAETLSGFSFFFMYLGWSAQFINEECTYLMQNAVKLKQSCRFVEIFWHFFIIMLLVSTYS